MPASRWTGFSVFRGRNSSSSRRNKKAADNPNSAASTSSSCGDSVSAAMQSFAPQQPWSAEAVASLPPPGLSGPGQIVFSPSFYDTTVPASPSSVLHPQQSEATNVNNKKPKRYLAFVSSPSTVIRTARSPPALYKPLTTGLYPASNNSNKQPQQHPAASSSSYVANYSPPQYVANGLAVHDASAPDAHAAPLPQMAASQQPAPPLHQKQKQQHPQRASPPSSGPPAPQERVLMCMDLTDISQNLKAPQPMLRMTRQSKRRPQQQQHQQPLDPLGNTPASSFSSNDAQQPAQEKMSLEERLRRERQRLTASSGSLTQFSWTWCELENAQGVMENCLRVLIPTRGNLYIQDGVLLEPPPSAKENSAEDGSGNKNKESSKTEANPTTVPSNAPRCIHDKTKHSAAVDPQFSPDGSMVAWTADGEIYVQSCGSNNNNSNSGDGLSAVQKDDNGSSSNPKPAATSLAPPVRLTFGAVQTADTCIRHGVADFVAQEEIDRYRGFWWHPDSTGILLVRVDESAVPPFRILHHDAPFAAANDTTSDPFHRPLSSAIPYEDHRYPFAGKSNPKVQLAFVEVDRESILQNRPAPLERSASEDSNDTDSMDMDMDDDVPSGHPLNGDSSAQLSAKENWTRCVWFDSPREASEYLARIHWLPDGSVAAQWQNRAQNVSVITRMDLERRKIRTLLTERSETWINLHHNFKVLNEAVHPDDCIPTEKQIPPMPNPLPDGSFSFLYASERTGFQHLYLYTFVPGIHGDQAIPLRAVSSGEWMVENIIGVDMEKDAVYVTGTFDSALERHLYAVPLLNRRLVAQEAAMEDETSINATNGVRRGLSKVMHALSGKGRNGRVQEAIWSSMRPVRLTIEPGMHNIVMDDDCEIFVDTSSDLDRPTSSRIYKLPSELWGSSTQLSLNLVYTLFDAIQEDTSLVNLVSNQTPLDGLPSGARLLSLPPPELISFPSSDGAETLHAAVYRPNPRIYGPGPYPLVCAVYGGPHVQRVNRSWSQCADMRAQRLRSLGFCVVKCDNRGSSRRGIAFESTIQGRLGQLEVLDQVAAVRHLTLRGVVDASRVGVYGWSYGGYLAAMCLCRAPDVFRCAVSGAPVTSWDGYDTHYTERYMGHPSENGAGYRESAVFDHVPNMNGKIMIVHGLLDENVHFRHTARLINKLVASEKDYDLLLFPEERHSPRRLLDRIYMEQRISDFFLRELCTLQQPSVDMMASSAMNPMNRPVGHL